MWILTIRSPLNEPREYVLKTGVNTLGRHTDNDIAITDESASRHHAVFVCKVDSVMIRDLDSTNGTFINGKRYSEPQNLKPGDQIRIGFHVVSIAHQQTTDTVPIRTVENQLNTRPLTQDFLLESVDQNAVLLHEVANRLTSALDLEKALKEISNFLRVAVGANKCYVIMAENFHQLEELGFSESIARQAIEGRSVVLIPNIQHLPSVSESAVRLRICSAICVPVITDDKVVALVFVYNTDPSSRPFDQNDVQLAVAVSHQAALAIQRTQILDQARVFEKWAYTDSLTGLNNRRYVLDLAKVEFERARRFQHPLVMVLVDVDDFKQVNDSCGHLIGDQVLIAVSERLSTHVRSVDLLGRYGGDEFIILLVETDLDEALKIAKRLNEHISNPPIETTICQLTITLSIGIAILADDIQNLDDFICRADEALYLAKNAGKNQVEVK